MSKKSTKRLGTYYKLSQLGKVIITISNEIVSRAGENQTDKLLIYSPKLTNLYLIFISGFNTYVFDIMHISSLFLTQGLLLLNMTAYNRTYQSPELILE